MVCCAWRDDGLFVILYSVILCIVELKVGKSFFYILIMETPKLDDTILRLEGYIL